MSECKAYNHAELNARQEGCPHCSLSRGEVMANELLIMPNPTYKAKLFEAPWETTHFKVAGTLDGFIDLAIPSSGTYPLSLEEAQRLVEALQGAISDVQTNCLYDADPLLNHEEK